MHNITGKTHAIFQRLPHFYDPSAAGDLIVRLVEHVGRALERTERDLYQVLHAHHVETADNIGSQGYTAAPDQRGDLDKIFALYLEAIGGTTQLVKMSPYVNARSLQVRRLAQLLHQAADPLLSALRERLPKGTEPLLARYAVTNAWFTPAEIQPGFVNALRRAQPPPAGFRFAAPPPTVMTYLYHQLRPRTQALLAASDASDALALQAAVATDLNEVLLRDSALYRHNAAAFDQYKLSPAAWALLGSLYPDVLCQRAAAEPEPEKRDALLTVLAQAEPPPAPPGDDQVRLNRLLLESAFAYDAETCPWGLVARSIPSLAEVRTALVEGVNALIKGEELFQPAWFPALVDAYPALRQRYGNDPAWLNRVLLEAALPTALEKSYTPYQERLRGLISVLRQGAATRAGIIALVAANLGLVEQTPAAERQRSRIRVEEFKPVQQTTVYQGLRPYSPLDPDCAQAVIKVNNPNLGPVTPEFQFTVQIGGRLITPVIYTHWALVNQTTGEEARYSGELRDQDWLTLLSDHTMQRNGVTVKPDEQYGQTPTLPPGESLLHIEALTDLGVGALAGTGARPAGRFDQTKFDESLFDRATLHELMPENVADVTIDLKITQPALTAGCFRVSVPWDLGDFPADPAGHPRNQIGAIIDKVKAAGVIATLSYEIGLADTHEVG